MSRTAPDVSYMQAKGCLQLAKMHVANLNFKKSFGRHFLRTSIQGRGEQFSKENGRFAFLSFLWKSWTTYDVRLRLIRKLAVDFLLVLIEFFSLGVTAEALRANVD